MRISSMTLFFRRERQNRGEKECFLFVRTQKRATLHFCSERKSAFRMLLYFFYKFCWKRHNNVIFSHVQLLNSFFSKMFFQDGCKHILKRRCSVFFFTDLLVNALVVWHKKRCDCNSIFDMTIIISSRWQHISEISVTTLLM